MEKVLLVGIGGGLGAVLRFLVSEWALRQWGTHFPLGTLITNLLGCFLMGVLLGITARYTPDPRIVLFFGVGLLGAFTTFSAFAYQTNFLFLNEHLGSALLSIALNNCVGLFLAWVGLKLTS